jgi:5-methyltetrahydropteroyltriglutamate--homocysteine methyltransferase
MVGVVDVGTEEIETAEDVAGRIRTALQYVSPERLYPCTDCGSCPGHGRQPAGRCVPWSKGRRSFGPS